MNNQYRIEFEEDALDEEDVSLSMSEISQAGISSSDWTTETMISQLTKGNISLNPSFQRRDAWTINRKSKYIESLILGFPVPQIVLAEMKTERGKYIVLDGKQRLLTLMQFVGIADGKNNDFRLTGLEIRADLNNKTFNDFSNNLHFQEDLDSFQNQTVRTVVIRKWPNPEFLHTVFLRLNTGSVPLSPQELRQAMFPGDFVTYIDQKAIESRSLKLLLGIEDPDFRMRDNELLVRYLSYKNFLSDYKGNLKLFLDNTCQIFNKNWEKNVALLEHQLHDFEESNLAGFEIFGVEQYGRKWNNSGFESRINRAVLDVMQFYFSNIDVRNTALEHKQVVFEEFKKLCVEDGSFRTSIETTTKSLNATETRFRLWGEKLSEILTIQLDIPHLEDNQILFSRLTD